MNTPKYFKWESIRIIGGELDGIEGVVSDFDSIYNLYTVIYTEHGRQFEATLAENYLMGRRE